MSSNATSIPPGDYARMVYINTPLKAQDGSTYKGGLLIEEKASGIKLKSDGLYDANLSYAQTCELIRVLQRMLRTADVRRHAAKKPVVANAS